MTSCEPSSFRDPSGFLFVKNGALYRQINLPYKENYNFLIKSGLHNILTQKGYLTLHKELKETKFQTPIGYKIIKPETIPFISYPYEWCFGQLKDAALLTLKIELESLKHRMNLKDASAYNIQFIGFTPIMIDTLSFEKYVDGKPWIAYKQFCQHFLAPLLLMSKKDIRLNQLLRIYIDGIPLDLASKLLPTSSYFNFSTLSHIHLHAKTQARYSDKKVDISKIKISKENRRALIASLIKIVEDLSLPKLKTEWGKYYTSTNYSSKAFSEKKKLVEKFAMTIKPNTAVDLGGNDGEFSQILSKNKIYTISCDIDPAAVEKGYQRAKSTKDKNLLPIIMDLTNPSASIGWANEERKSLLMRGPFDLVMSLALIHHLAITNNLPFENIASYFSKLAKHLIIEFVPKEDSKVQKLLATRQDIFPNYSESEFENVFDKYFFTVKKEQIRGSKRTLYLMKKK